MARASGIRLRSELQTTEVTGKLAAIDEPVVLIRPARLLRAARLQGDALYEATRGVWRLDAKRAGAARLAFTVDQGKVVEVYEIEMWQPAGTSSYVYRPAREVKRLDRHEFAGRVASPQVRRRYVGMDVSEFFPKGAQNPIRYVNC